MGGGERGGECDERRKTRDDAEGCATGRVCFLACAAIDTGKDVRDLGSTPVPGWRGGGRFGVASCRLPRFHGHTQGGTVTIAGLAIFEQWTIRASSPPRLAQHAACRRPRLPSERRCAPPRLRRQAHDLGAEPRTVSLTCCLPSAFLQCLALTLTSQCPLRFTRQSISVENFIVASGAEPLANQN